MIKKVLDIVSFSGGMDSATLLALAKVMSDQKGGIVRAFGFTYGSKHNQYELEAANRFASSLGVDYDVIDLTTISGFLSSCLLKSGGAIPEGHYAQDNMTKTVVPGRNTIFASILLGIAQSLEANTVTMAVHSGDHTIYPDCRPDWVNCMQATMYMASEGKVQFHTPFLRMDKTDILDLSFNGFTFSKELIASAQAIFPLKRPITKIPPLNVDYSMTRTCYKDQPIACGRCGSCQERLEAFRNHNREDPLEYEFRGVLPKSS
jgi:7-cyano-7-deazaguanine synthase